MKDKIFNIIKGDVFKIFVITFFVVGCFGGLTKVGVIPNFLDLELLCSGEDIDNYYIDNVNQPCNGDDLFFDRCNGNASSLKKPVIYLYPEQEQEIQVKLEYNGEIFADYPEYNDEIKGWNVIAKPDGTLINKEDSLEYSYLFWEGNPVEKINWDLSKGFIVKGEDTKKFLQEILPKMGLTPKEYNEFIVYWFPLMQDNKYNLIHFAQEQYTNEAPLTTIPNYDSMLRVFMVYKALEKTIDIEPQDFKDFERKGFTVIEWGGTEVK